MQTFHHSEDESHIEYIKDKTFVYNMGDTETNFLKIKCSKSNSSEKKIAVHEIQPLQESLENHILKFD